MGGETNIYAVQGQTLSYPAQGETNISYPAQGETTQPIIGSTVVPSDVIVSTFEPVSSNNEFESTDLSIQSTLINSTPEQSTVSTMNVHSTISSVESTFIDTSDDEIISTIDSIVVTSEPVFSSIENSDDFGSTIDVTVSTFEPVISTIIEDVIGSAVIPS